MPTLRSRWADRLPATARSVRVRPWRRGACLALLAVALAGCADAVTAPGSRPTASRAAVHEASAVLRWNETARALVARHRENPPRAARGYALLSMAQYDALVALRGAGRGPHASSGERPNAAGPLAGPQDEHAAVVAASLEVLRALFPASADRLAAEAEAELAGRRPARRGAGGGDPDAAAAVGRAAARRVLDDAAADGADAVWQGTTPVGPGLWYSSASPAQAPLLPLWGSVRPRLLRSGDELRPPPPPAYGSPEFAAALAEVRQLSDGRTAEHVRIAELWADGAGTATPPGHWNEIAADLLQRHHVPMLRAARTLALLNMALLDASIACWDAKYAYWLLRPSQADPGITTAVPLPNFPAYTSGHATFSGAAAEFLGHVFPAEAAALDALAEEAALSRVYGGIHYRFDSDVGLVAGRAIGRLAVERGRELAPVER